MTPRKKKESVETPEVEQAPSAPVAEPDAGAIPLDAIVTPDPVPVDEVVVESAAGDEAPVAVPIIQQMVAFHLGGQRYALPIRSVQEIQQIVALSEAHGGASAVIGMVNLRGHVIPAIDMRLLLGLAKQEYRLDTPMIICRVAGGFVALVVDDVEDVIDLPEGCLTPPPKLHALADRMVGVCHLDTDLVFLLSVEKLVRPLGLDVGSGW